MIQDEGFSENRAREIRFSRGGRDIIRSMIGKGLSRRSSLVKDGPAPVQSLRVLMYHRVFQDPGEDILAVTPFQFSEQMRWLLKEGYPILSVPEALDQLKEGSLPDGALCLTFDDGYRDNFEYAYPILASDRIPAMIFPVTGFVLGEGEHPRYKGQKVKYLTIDHIREMNQAGIDFGCHTHTHAHLSKISIEECFQEVSQAKKLLEEWVGKSIRIFAYPNGIYRPEHFEILEEVGFDAAFSVRAGAIVPKDSRWDLRRTEISGRDSLRDFICKIRGGMDLMHQLYQGVRGFYT